MKQLYLFDQPSNSEQSTTPTMPIFTYWKVFIDGASRQNPGPSGAGVYILANEKPVEKRGFYLGTKTNNQAEYTALLLGLFLVRQKIQKNDPILIISDSQLLVRQLQGAYKIKKPELQKLYACAQHLLKGLNYDVAHVLREDNTYADELANEGIDKKIPLPPAFDSLLTTYEQKL
jgi:ribonuclease HI